MCITTPVFLQRLWALQERLGIRDRTLALQVGIHPSHLSHLRAGRRRRLGAPIAARMLRLYPELEEERRAS